MNDVVLSINNTDNRREIIIIIIIIINNNSNSNRSIGYDNDDDNNLTYICTKTPDAIYPTILNEMLCTGSFQRLVILPNYVTNIYTNNQLFFKGYVYILYLI